MATGQGDDTRREGLRQVRGGNGLGANCVCGFGGCGDSRRGERGGEVGGLGAKWYRVKGPRFAGARNAREKTSENVRFCPVRVRFCSPSNPDVFGQKATKPDVSGKQADFASENVRLAAGDSKTRGKGFTSGAGIAVGGEGDSRGRPAPVARG